MGEEEIKCPKCPATKAEFLGTGHFSLPQKGQEELLKKIDELKYKIKQSLKPAETQKLNSELGKLLSTVKYHMVDKKNYRCLAGGRKHNFFVEPKEN